MEFLSDHDVLSISVRRSRLKCRSLNFLLVVSFPLRLSQQLEHHLSVAVSATAGCFRCLGFCNRPPSYQLTCCLLPPPCCLPEPREREESLPALQGSLFFLRPLRGSLFEQGAWLASSSLEPRPQGSRKLRCSSKPGHACSSSSDGR